MFSIRTAYRPIPAQIHLFGVVLLIGGASLGTSLITRRSAKTLSAIQRLIWLRCSFWLLLPMLFVPISVVIAVKWFEHRTSGMQPGNYQIALEYRNAIGLAELSIPIVLFIGTAIWWFRWHSLRTLVGLRKGSRVAQVLGAITLTLLSTFWASFTIGIATAGD
jgi:heme/copper-type cytochrome/quinol oxidase subunit 2